MGLQVIRRFILLHKLHYVFMEQLLLFVTVTHTGTGITKPEVPYLLSMDEEVTVLKC